MEDADEDAETFLQLLRVKLYHAKKASLPLYVGLKCYHCEMSLVPIISMLAIMFACQFPAFTYTEDDFNFN